MNDIGVDNIYVINVRSDVERRKHVENQLAQFKLKGEFIHECDIPDLNQQVLDAYFKEEDMSLAQKSCAMKHFSALKRILANGDRLALVLEDDVVFANDFVKSICLGLKEVESFTHPFVIFIGSGGNFYTPKKLRKPNQKLYKATRGRFADCYILDFRAAKIRADWIRRNKINQPIDNQFQDILLLPIQALSFFSID